MRPSFRAVRPILLIRLRRVRDGFQATAKGARPSVDVMAIADTPKRAVSECMEGVAACLEVGP